MMGLETELRDELGLDHQIKLSTVFPFTVNTGLAVDPTTRFPLIFPISEPGKKSLVTWTWIKLIVSEDCARSIIEGILREEPEIYIPKVCEGAFKVTALFPKRAQIAMQDFFECRVGYDEKKAS